MITEYYSIVKILSQLQVVPYFKWNNCTKDIISALFEDMPFFITKSGNLFIGESSPEKIESGKVCLQAHLDHPGGFLHFSENNDYMFSKFYGLKTSKYLVGRKFGAFLPGVYGSLEQLEVEHSCNNEKDDAVLFFKANKDLMKSYKTGELIIHYDSMLSTEDNILKNWNLDDILNAALVIYLLKHENYINEFYGLITVNEEIGHGGLYEFLNLICGKELYFISMDAISSKIETPSNFGIRTKQGEFKLDKFIPKEINSDMSKYMSEIPYGRCEGVTLINENNQGICLYIKIDNFHNGLPFKDFGAEAINIQVLSEYISFVKDISTKINKHYRIKNINTLFKNKELNIEIIDHASEMRDIILSCSSYPDYLTKGLTEIRKIFYKYKLNIPNINNDIFEAYKKNLESKEIPIVNKSNVEEILDYLIDELISLFKTQKDILIDNISNIEIIQILLGNFNACNFYTPNRVIMLSNDRIEENDILRVITHELTHYLSSKIWRGMNMPQELKMYYDEGLAIYLSAKKNNIDIQQSLRIKKEKYNEYLNKKESLENFFSDYYKGNYFKLYKGKYHEYFVKNDIPHPFYANEKNMPRYGYFLSAIETKQLIEEGDFYEKLLCE